MQPSKPIGIGFIREKEGSCLLRIVKLYEVMVDRRNSTTLTALFFLCLLHQNVQPITKKTAIQKKLDTQLFGLFKIHQE